jgi:hypothetical protein
VVYYMQASAYGSEAVRGRTDRRYPCKFARHRATAGSGRGRPVRRSSFLAKVGGSRRNSEMALNSGEVSRTADSHRQDGGLEPGYLVVLCSGEVGDSTEDSS